MFHYKNELMGKANINALWKLYTDVNKWNTWDKSIETAKLNGEFKPDTTGVMFLSGMPPLNFVINTVEDKKSFTNSAMIGEITIEFGHYIILKEENIIEITHTVMITGGEEKQLELIGKGISSSIPSAMNSLLKLAQ